MRKKGAAENTAAPLFVERNESEKKAVTVHRFRVKDKDGIKVLKIRSLR